MEFWFEGGKENNLYTVENVTQEGNICAFTVRMKFSGMESPEPVRLLFRLPCKDMYAVWSPAMKMERYLGPNWKKRTTSSRLAAGMPVHCIHSLNGKNRLTIALSDAKTPLEIATGICEEDGFLDCRITFFTVKVGAMTEYCATVRLDMRQIPWYDSVYDVAAWWERDCGYAPAYVPEEAKMPMYSTWYNYHQNFTPEELLSECALGKEMGMDAIIIDDGWQTEDSSRGYRCCGDWQAAPGRIADMKDFIRRIHQT